MTPNKIIILFGLLLTLAGCTVVPVQIRAKVASFDGGTQNSGVIAAMPGGEWNVTSHWRDRFNALSVAYGTNFIPHITADSGITPWTNGTFIATSQAVANFGKMNLLYKSQAR
jgi:hypothetical protein